MFCRKCGKEIPDESDFCAYCGTPVHPDINRQKKTRRYVLNGYNDKKRKRLLITIGAILCAVVCFIIVLLIKKDNFHKKNNEISDTSLENDTPDENYIETLDYDFNAFLPQEGKYPLVAKGEFDLPTEKPEMIELMGTHANVYYYFVYDRKGKLEYYIDDYISDTADSTRDIKHYLYSSNGDLLHIYHYKSERSKDEATFSTISYCDKTDYIYDEKEPSISGNGSRLLNVFNLDASGFYKKYEYYYDDEGHVNRGIERSGGNNGELPASQYQYFYDSNDNWIATELTIGSQSSTYENSTPYNDPISAKSISSVEIPLNGYEVEFVNTYSATQENYRFLNNFDELGFLQGQYEEIGVETDTYITGSLFSLVNDFYDALQNKDRDKLYSLYPDISSGEKEYFERKMEYIDSVENNTVTHIFKTPFTDYYFIPVLPRITYTGFRSMPVPEIYYFYAFVDEQKNAHFTTVNSDKDKVLSGFADILIQFNQKIIDLKARASNGFDMSSAPKRLVDILNYVYGTVDSIGEESNAMKDGVLPDHIFEIVKGHYEDGYGETVDVQSPDSIVRFVKGGHEDHIYDEKICGYSEQEDGYLIYIDWDGEKYVYYYMLDNGSEKLHMNFDDGWNPSMSNFIYTGINSYTKTSSDTEADNTISKDVGNNPVGGQYISSMCCKLVKKGNDYYLTDTYFMQMDTYEHKDIPKGQGVKIAHGATAGIATKVSLDENEYESIVPSFTYEYRDFYNTVDKQFSSGHWQSIDDGAFAFEVDGMVLYNMPLVSFNSEGEIVQLLDYYSE